MPDIHIPDELDVPKTREWGARPTFYLREGSPVTIQNLNAIADDANLADDAITELLGLVAEIRAELAAAIEHGQELTSMYDEATANIDLLTIGHRILLAQKTRHKEAREQAEAALAERDRMLDELAAAIMSAGAFLWQDASHNHPARVRIRTALRELAALRASAEEGSE